MGLFSASTAITRYLVLPSPDTPGPLDIEAKLREHAFRDIEFSTQERAYGWVMFEDMMETSWSMPAERAGYCAFALRLDTKRIPGAVLKKEFRLAEERLKAARRAEGKGYVSAEDRRELRQQVRQDLLGRAFAVPAVFDVVWDLGKGTVYLASARQAVQLLFEEHFAMSFERRLALLTPYVLGLKCGADEARLNAFSPGAIA